MHTETESQARASLGKPQAFHLRYASQVQQRRSQYLNQGNYRIFNLSTAIKLHGNIIMKNMEPPQIPILKCIRRPNTRAHPAFMRDRRGSKASPTIPQWFKLYTQIAVIIPRNTNVRNPETQISIWISNLKS